MALLPSPDLHHFNGGLRLKLHHDESTRKPIVTMPLPDRLILPLQQHIGDAATPCVNPGNYIFKGQLLASAPNPLSAAVHAPTSGILTAIKQHPIPHPNGINTTCLILEPDEKDRWIEKDTSCMHYANIPAQQLINRIRAAGIVGLGGAAFPSDIKLRTTNAIDILIINAAECEPYIACDDMLMRQYAHDIIHGIMITKKCLSAKRCLIGIEDFMEEAYAALKIAIETQNASGIEIIVVPTLYPTGGERQLIKVITGKEVPTNGLPADIGIICHNVATAAAIYRAVVLGEPLISRIITITGRGIVDPRNIQVLFGTPIKDIIAFCGGYTEQAERLIMGGPMMGYALQSDELPITKTSNCILVAAQNELATPHEPQPCIRCGLCEQACPANLLPQQLYWYAKASDTEKLNEYGLSACIECGCCAYVCPSEIPLVDNYREAKSKIRNIEIQQEKAQHAQQRFDARQQRLTQAEQTRKEKLQQKQRAFSNSDKPQQQNEIQAMLERIKSKQKGHKDPSAE